MAYPSKNTNTIPERHAHVWASAVGTDATLLSATLSPINTCASCIYPTVIGVAGTLVLKNQAGDNITLTAADIVAKGGAIDGQWQAVIASGSSGIYGLLVEW